VGLIIVVLVGVVIVLGAALALSLTEGGLRHEPVDHGDLGLPDRPLTADDIATLRFRTGIRGYRMEDVDAALDRVAESLRASEGGSGQ
jgi:DivIVA domain-containing protein